jgi:hypothetical protein
LHHCRNSASDFNRCELAREFARDDEHTDKQLFSETRSKLRMLRITSKLAITEFKLSNMKKDNFVNKYSTNIQISCLPQENGRWVSRATTYDFPTDIVEYGQNREESITKVLRKIADLFENSNLKNGEEIN